MKTPASKDLSTDAIAVFITAPTADEAARLADLLVSSHLAACVQILPAIESVYFWKGSVERQTEVLLIAKTVQSQFAALEREVRAVHSYETPEIVAVPITAGSAPYLDWLSSGVAKE
ncbi:MAG: divalent-cation tolerance protein CutA [bacterium]